MNGARKKGNNFKRSSKKTENEPTKKSKFIFKSKKWGSNEWNFPYNRPNMNEKKGNGNAI